MSRVVPEYKEAARSRILGAALAAFAEKGYDQTTMDDIAHRLGVSKGTIYLYFASKEELFAKLTESRQSALRQMLRDSLKDGDLLQCSQAFFDTAMDAQDVYSRALRLRSYRKVPETRPYELSSSRTTRNGFGFLASFWKSRKERGSYGMTLIPDCSHFR